MMDKVKTFFMLSEEDQKQLKKKYFQVTPNVCFCDDFVVMLKSDGTISVSGNSRFNTRKWTNITKICSGSHHIAGLKSDGTVVAFGDNTYHQCDVSAWKNVQNIFAKDNLTVGITNNDEMLIAGSSDTYSDEMKLIEQNAVKLSDFMRKTECDLNGISQKIIEQSTSTEIKVLEQIAAKLDNFIQKAESDFAKLSKRIDEQHMQLKSLKDVISDTNRKVNILDTKEVYLNNADEIKDKAKTGSDYVQHILPKIDITIKNDTVKDIKSEKKSSETIEKREKELEEKLSEIKKMLHDETESSKKKYIENLSKHLCYGCMKEYNGEQICPHCGFDKDTEQSVPYLALGTNLKNGNYILGKKITSNAEGAKYIAYNISTHSAVIIREFIPVGIGGRSKNRNDVIVKSNYEKQYAQLHEDFLKYYRNIAKMSNLNAITPILDIFSENNTSYVVEEAYDSIPFTEYLERRGGKIEWSVARSLFMPLVSAMSSLHEAGIGNYAISPSNLVVTADGKLRLKGFAIVNIRRSGDFCEPELINGCSAPEQYKANCVLDESTDIYGLTATLFYALVGKIPERLKGRTLNFIIIPTTIFKELPSHIVTALSKGLEFNKNDRIQTFDELYKYLSTPDKVSFEYRANDNELLLLGYTDNSSDVDIPSIIDEKVVKGLVGTFFSCKHLKVVKIPGTVNYIGEKSFYGCRVLRDVYIPESVISIADDAFGRCDMRLMIHGKKGSYAEKYAKQKRLKFAETN